MQLEEKTRREREREREENEGEKENEEEDEIDKKMVEGKCLNKNKTKQK